MFIWFAVIYESPQKQTIGKQLEKNIDDIHSFIPKDFVWSTDHTKPAAIQHGKLSKEELLIKFKNLQNVKKAEILCGYIIDRNDVVKMNPSDLLEQINTVYKKLTPLYNLVTKAEALV